ncbi:hypothetical protein D9Q81_05880 [Candidatus Korarchaeum cryptofilum]|uniref:Uncharacterized protein n=1 Tax=Candidatus Korarchaeum cryptofilum TaxID=498846 RepID=A0A429G434_9CREN|nr:hypothetical protein [Candidatus Korarchaeum cryptofilum]RSN68538.1 hypothetical protein D9Q81_05880 [Candidatus Korarchaeum cryptofilum]
MKIDALFLLGILFISLGLGSFVAAVALKNVPDLGIELPSGAIIPLHSAISMKSIPFRSIVVKGYVQPSGCNGEYKVDAYYLLAVDKVKVTDWKKVTPTYSNNAVLCGVQNKYSFRITGDELGSALNKINASAARVEVFVLFVPSGSDPTKYEDAAVMAGEFLIKDMIAQINEARNEYESLKARAAAGDLAAKQQLATEWREKEYLVTAGDDPEIANIYKLVAQGRIDEANRIMQSSKFLDHIAKVYGPDAVDAFKQGCSMDGTWNGKPTAVCPGVTYASWKIVINPDTYELATWPTNSYATPRANYTKRIEPSVSTFKNAYERAMRGEKVYQAGDRRGECEMLYKCCMRWGSGSTPGTGVCLEYSICSKNVPCRVMNEMQSMINLQSTIDLGNLKSSLSFGVFPVDNTPSIVVYTIALFLGSFLLAKWVVRRK